MIPLRRPQDVVQFTPDAAERIGRAVLTVENQVPAGKPLVFEALPPAAGKSLAFGAPPPAARKVFRVCTFTGAWSKNTLKTVTFKYTTSTPNTVSSSNLFADIGTAASARNCAIAREGTAWYLIAAEC